MYSIMRSKTDYEVRAWKKPVGKRTFTLPGWEQADKKFALLFPPNAPVKSA